MRDPLVANSSYVALFADPSSSLHRYTHTSAPVSTKKEILDVPIVTKMRRDTKLSSHLLMAGPVYLGPVARGPTLPCMASEDLVVVTETRVLRFSSGTRSVTSRV